MVSGGMFEKRIWKGLVEAFEDVFTMEESELIRFQQSLIAVLN